MIVFGGFGTRAIELAALRELLWPPKTVAMFTAAFNLIHGDIGPLTAGGEVMGSIKAVDSDTQSYL